jgi:hypothetical protein
VNFERPWFPSLLEAWQQFLEHVDVTNAPDLRTGRAAVAAVGYLIDAGEGLDAATFDRHLAGSNPDAVRFRAWEERDDVLTALARFLRDRGAGITPVG